MEIAFGYSERRRDTEIWSIEKIQSHLRDGLHYNDMICQQYESIKIGLVKLETLLPAEKAQVVGSSREELVSQRIADACSEAHLSGDGRPVFSLAAIPKQTITIPSLFETRSAEVVKLLESPPSIRWSGFDINTGAQPKIIRGDLRRAAHDGHKSP